MTYQQLYAVLTYRMPSEFEARQLFSFVTGFESHDLSIVRSVAVPSDQSLRCEKLLSRRLSGEPLQYLLEEWEFYSLPMYVGEGVLIPRADTELLVDTALELARSFEGAEILDLCSGSGCVAIAIAKNLPGAKITALELSESAAGYMRRNIERNNVEVSAVLGDVFDYEHPAGINIITANPPYIAENEFAELEPELSHEPRMALSGGEDGLDFYRAIAKRYKPQLMPGGYICFEVGLGQSEVVYGILSQNGFEGIEVRADLRGIERVVIGRV